MILTTTENFEYEGEWWLPKNSDKKFRGKLKVSSDEGITLYLLTFEMGIIQLPNNRTDLILGSSADGKKITLYQCLIKNKSTYLSRNSASAEEFVFVSNFVFVGTHFSKVEDISFKNLDVSYFNLEKWASISGFKIARFKPNIRMIKYRMPKSINFKKYGDFQITINFSASYPALEHPQTEASIKQSIWMTFTPSTSKTLDDFLKTMRIMQNFLTLAMSEPTYPIAIEGQSESEKNSTTGSAIYSPIKVVFAQSVNKSTESNALRPFNMLFTLQEIKRERRIIRNWFEKNDILEPVCDLYFSTLYQKGMYLNNELLNLTQALESYHRRTMKNSELSTDKHLKRVQAILKKTPDKYKDWLEKQLEYSNEPRLRKRLKDIWDKCPTAVLAKLGTRDTFIDLTVNTRNYWTHFDETIKQKAATNPNDLYYLVLKLRTLLQVCFLEEMGFKIQDVERLMTNPYSNPLWQMGP